MSEKPKGKGKPTGGRPAIVFELRHLDRAQELLGQRGYVSRVATELAQEFKFGRSTAYDLIRCAQAATVAALRGDAEGSDPLVQVYLSMLAIMCGEDERTCDRINAAGQIIKMLGLKKIADALGGGDVDEFLANILARRAARHTGADASASNN